MRTFTIEQWNAARALRSEHQKLVQKEWRRLWVVERTLKEWFVEGDVKTVLRPHFGGDFSNLLPKAIWNGEDIWDRFVSCKMDPCSPFSINAFSEALGEPRPWIFVDVPSLEAALRRLALRPETGANGVGMSVYLSPALRCAFDTLLALDIRPDNMPKKSEVEAEIARHWQGEGKLSKRMLSAMSTLLRDEESKRGRASDHDRTRRANLKGRQGKGDNQ